MKEEYNKDMDISEKSNKNSGNKKSLKPNLKKKKKS
jgi:hypothetical protein